MPREPHPWLRETAAVLHGGDADVLLDLSASIAPLGPSPAAVAAARAAPLDRYPERVAASLTRAMGGELGLDPERVVAGAGAADLLVRTFAAHLRPGDAVVVVAPCFGEYARAARACGATTVRWSAPAKSGFAVDPPAIAALARQHRAALGVLARPANPTGVAVALPQLAELMAEAPGTRWVVDEAFIGLADDPRSSAGGDAVVVRSLTKELALPGLRVAVADAPPAVAGALRALAPPWIVSAPALAAALAGLADSGHRRATRAAVSAGRARLLTLLDQLGAGPTHAVANFVCAAGLRPAEAERAAGRLRAHGIAVRLCDDLGLRGGLRLAVPPPAEQERVERALREAMSAVPA